MGKGQKTCLACGSINGPRAWNCKNCGKGFKIKGETKPNIDPNQSPEPEIPDKDKTIVNKKKVSDYFQEISPDRTEVWGINTRLYESNCGNYRIRFRDTFHGIDVNDGKPYLLLKKDINNIWEPVDQDRYMFKKIGGAVKFYLKIVKAK